MRVWTFVQYSWLKIWIQWPHVDCISVQGGSLGIYFIVKKWIYLLYRNQKTSFRRTALLILCTIPKKIHFYILMRTNTYEWSQSFFVNGYAVFILGPIVVPVCIAGQEVMPLVDTVATHNFMTLNVKSLSFGITYYSAWSRSSSCQDVLLSMASLSEGSQKRSVVTSFELLVLPTINIQSSWVCHSLATRHWSLWSTCDSSNRQSRWTFMVVTPGYAPYTNEKNIPLLQLV
jgi:hypothetical protein